MSGKLEKTKLYLHDFLFKIPYQENLFKYKACNAQNLFFDATEEIFVEQLKKSDALDSLNILNFNLADLSKALFRFSHNKLPLLVDSLDSQSYINPKLL